MTFCSIYNSHDLLKFNQIILSKILIFNFFSIRDKVISYVVSDRRDEIAGRFHIQ